MILAPIPAHSDYVLVGILHQVHPLVPSAHPGTEILHSTRLCHGVAGINRLLRRIAPCQAYGSLRQLRDEFRLPADDIPEKLHPLPAAVQKSTQLLQIIDIHLLRPDLLRRPARLLAAKVECLVRADVELVGREQRPVLGEHALYERQRPIVRRVDRVVIHPVPEGKGRFPRTAALTELTVAARREQCVQVAKACQRRDQLDVQLPAIRVQLQDVLRRQRRVIAPHLRKIPEQIRVLDVELELV